MQDSRDNPAHDGPIFYWAAVGARGSLARGASDCSAAACRYLDLGQYSSWDEEKRIEWLERELMGKRPLIPATMSMTPEVRRLPATRTREGGTEGPRQGLNNIWVQSKIWRALQDAVVSGCDG